jgi:hypothetical protein
LLNAEKLLVEPMKQLKEGKKMSWIEAIFKIFADNPPSIAIALGGLMLLIGYLSQIQGLVTAGWVFFFAGVLLQILWLFRDKM